MGEGAHCFSNGGATHREALHEGCLADHRTRGQFEGDDEFSDREICLISEGFDPIAPGGDQDLVSEIRKREAHSKIVYQLSYQTQSPAISTPCVIASSLRLTGQSVVGKKKGSQAFARPPFFCSRLFQRPDHDGMGSRRRRKDRALRRVDMNANRGACWIAGIRLAVSNNNFSAAQSCGRELCERC